MKEQIKDLIRKLRQPTDDLSSIVDELESLLEKNEEIANNWEPPLMVFGAAVPGFLAQSKPWRSTMCI